MLKIINGDVLKNKIDGFKFIPQCNNDIGAYGAGISGVISKRWPKVEELYRKWFINKEYIHTKISIPFELGQVQYILVEDKTVVCNMIGQHLIGRDENGNAPVRYAALVKCMEKMVPVVKKYNGQIHTPRFASGLAGGNQEFIEELIKEIWVNNGIDVIIYDYKPTLNDLEG